MDYIVYFDFCAIALSIVLLFITFFRRNYPSTQQILFRILLLVNIISSTFEVVCSYLWSNEIALPLWGSYLITCFELFFHFSIHFVFLIYIINLIRGNIGLKVERIIYGIIFGLVSIFIFTNPAHQLITSIDVSGKFTNGFGSIIIQVLAVISIVYPIFLTAIYHKKLQNYEALNNIIFLIFLIVAVIIEAIFPKVLVEHFVIAVAFSMLTIIFDNPEVYFHEKTNIYNENAFYGMYLKRIDRKIPLKFLAFAFKDHDLLVKKFGYGRIHTLELNVLKECRKRYGKMNIFMFPKDVAVIDARNIDTKKEAEYISNYTFKNIKTEYYDLKMQLCFFEISVPDKVQKYTDLKDAIYMNLFDKDHTNDTSLITYYDEKLFEEKRREQEISMLLHEAVVNDLFEVYYQPLYYIKTGKFVGLEALVRLNKQINGKNVSPDEFIPLAEKIGLIYQIDEIVFEKTCRFIRNTDIKKYGIKFIDINLSLLKLLDSSAPLRYKELASRYDVNPSFINLEITETAEGDQNYMSTIKENISVFEDAGFKFSLDDYGSGYSTVIYMAEMDTQLVKIDSSIMWNAMKSKKYYTVLENCVRLIYCFDKKCLVEGVENEEMLNVCRRLGVDYLQGYYFSKPLKEDDLIDFLISHKN